MNYTWNGTKATRKLKRNFKLWQSTNCRHRRIFDFSINNIIIDPLYSTREQRNNLAWALHVSSQRLAINQPMWMRCVLTGSIYYQYLNPYVQAYQDLLSSRERKRDVSRIVYFFHHLMQIACNVPYSITKPILNWTRCSTL